MTRRRSRDCLSTCFSTPIRRRRRRSPSISTPLTIRYTGLRRSAASTAITTTTVICRFTCSAAGICWPPNCARPTSMRAPAASKRSRGSSPASASCWPKVRILLRADSGLARDALMAWCENNSVDFLFGLAKNARLNAEIQTELAAVQAEPTQRQAGATLQGLNLANPQELEPQAPGRRQGGMDKGQSQSVVCRHLAGARGARGPPPLREALLRPRRDGKPHQGMPARPLRRPHLGPHHARQPAAVVVRLYGLCLDLRLASHRAGPYPVCPGIVRYHPPQALEDLCAGPYQRAPHQARHAVGLSLSGRLPRRTDRRRALTRTRKPGPNNLPTTLGTIAPIRTRRS